MARRELRAVPTVSKGFLLKDVSLELRTITQDDEIRVPCGDGDGAFWFFHKRDTIILGFLEGSFLRPLGSIAVEFYSGIGQIGQTHEGHREVYWTQAEWDAIWAQNPASIVIIDIKPQNN